MNLADSHLESSFISQVELFATVVFINAVGARVDARVWSAIRRAEKEKEAVAAANAAIAKRVLLDNPEALKALPKPAKRKGTTDPPKSSS